MLIFDIETEGLDEATVLASAGIAVQTQSQDGNPVSGVPDKELKGGQLAECWVHSGQQVLVKEVSQ